MAVPSLETEVAAVARQLARRPVDGRRSASGSGWWSEQLLAWAMADPHFKTQLFRFTDVFPATADDADVARHLGEYFASVRRPRFLAWSARAAPHLPALVVAGLARWSITRMARQFIVGETPSAALPRLQAMWDSGCGATVDLLGEKVVTDAEADRYALRLHGLLDALLAATPSWSAQPRLEADDLGRLPRANLSIKPTAVAPLLAPLTGDLGLAEARDRLMPVLQRAAAAGAFVWFDMESYDVKDLTHRLFRSLMDEPSLAGLHGGIVLQAYLKDSYDDLLNLLTWGSGRSQPISVRLVKGAYWDAERIHAQAEGWGVPVFEDKDETDANYERCVDALHAVHGSVRAAFASHNLRSLAYAVARARSLGISDDGYEIQMLYGMAEDVQAAASAAGFRVRVYAPVGDLVPGMAYLVRRLLENTSNDSFVRQRFSDGRNLDELLAPPDVAGDLPHEERRALRPRTDGRRPSPYEPEPATEWRDEVATAEFATAVDDIAERLERDVPARIAGRDVHTETKLVSVDPADPQVIVARSASCTAVEAEAAMAAAREGFEHWRHTPAVERADVLFGAADWFRHHRFDVAALEVREAGKPWAEADADVGEAIDFCEYYGREMLRLDRGALVQSPPGEGNAMRYRPKGIGVVIAPWNFPLAIPTGMTVAGLVTGNAVILKPAEQTPAVAQCLVTALESGGLPPGVLALLPGVGEEVGAHLVSHPDIAWIAFTGSKPVGLAIVAEAAIHRPGQRQVKRVIAEMGGKNALIVDHDADLDQAVPAIMTSAFGFSGQKCSAASRLIVVGDVLEPLLERLSGALEELVIGPPVTASTQLGPLIDLDAQERVRSYLELAGAEGRIVAQRADVPSAGFFAPPTVVVVDDPKARVATEEIFGPVLTVLQARDFDEAIALANDSDYALTAGLLSRSPAHVERATNELRAGNIYINRSTTGAVVGRQPFGGYGLSGVGSKAGGPDYLLQFCDPYVVTENTLRQGFAPEG